MKKDKISPLGQATVYVETYNSDLLFPISRSVARDKIGARAPFPFDGVDLWTGYELSWLNLKGKPEIALADFSFPCASPNIVESKSLKLYLNSFNQSQFASFKEVQSTIAKDLSAATQYPIDVDLYPHEQLNECRLDEFPGLCLDHQDIEIDTYQVDKSFLFCHSTQVNETLYSNLLKSNCLATGQPDWGSVLIRYSGKKIDHEGLLKYIISFRRHSGFAEYCTEQIFYDILHRCAPEQLTVYCRYTRRGGLDINPFRSNFENHPENIRQPRQ